MRSFFLSLLVCLHSVQALDLPQPGTAEWFTIPVGDGFHGKSEAIPYYVARGAQAGPSLAVLGGVHGDEISGVLAVRKMIADASYHPERGALILVPVAALPAFERRSRYFPDRKDLNRSFPGRSRGSEASRFAHTLFQEIVSQATHVVDLHSAAIGRTNAPQTRGAWKSEEDPVFQMARAFGAPLMVHSSLIQGTLRALCQSRGIPYVLFEGGEARRTDAASARTVLQGIRGVMGWLEMQESPTPASESIVLNDSTWVRAPQGGILEHFAVAGKAVKKGELLYKIHAPLSTETAEVRAPFDARVLGLATEGLIRQGDALLNLGTF